MVSQPAATATVKILFFFGTTVRRRCTARLAIGPNAGQIAGKWKKQGYGIESLYTPVLQLQK
jgi:hypothetical protein